MFVFTMSSVMVVSCTIFSLPSKESACETSVSYREMQSSLTMYHCFVDTIYCLKCELVVLPLSGIFACTFQME